jgi:hypothetical protein
MAIRSEKELALAGEQLYEQYAKPLEAEHAGQFIAVAPDGRTVLGDTMLEVARGAA